MALPLTDITQKVQLRHFYRPQRSCEGYVFTGVCLSKGGWYPSMPCRWYPSMPCRRSPGGCYPSMHCRWYPSMPCNRSPGRSAPRGLLPGGGVCGDPPPQKQMATVADGTHPTGMHSCLLHFLLLVSTVNFQYYSINRPPIIRLMWRLLTLNYSSQLVQ